jgi:NitT/TauT family transport system ATP-binding protein
MMSMCDLPAVTARNVSRAFGSFVAIENISFEVAARRFVSIVGPSGCGKSTLLNIIAGLTSPSEGQIEVFGEPLVGIKSSCILHFSARRAAALEDRPREHPVRAMPAWVQPEELARKGARMGPAYWVGWFRQIIIPTS